MCDRLRIGLVGCGGFGDFFSDYLVQFADIAALCDVADAKKEEISNRHSLDVPHYTDYREMIDAGGLDAVAVTTVNSEHAEVVVAAAEAGFHVYCEKPMALNVPECWRMVRACQANQVKLMVGHKRRLRPVWARMIELTADEHLGPPLAITAATYADLRDFPYWDTWWGNPETGGGLYHLHGVHVIDWFRGMCGDATRVTAMRGPQHDAKYGYPDILHTTIRFQSGSVASINTGITNPIHKFRESEGPWGECRNGGFKLVPQMDHIDLYWRRLDDEDVRHERYDMGVDEAFSREVGDFVRWVQEDRAPCLTWVEGLRCVEIMEAAYRSAENEGAPIALPLYPELEDIGKGLQRS